MALLLGASGWVSLKLLVILEACRLLSNSIWSHSMSLTLEFHSKLTVEWLTQPHKAPKYLAYSWDFNLTAHQNGQRWLIGASWPVQKAAHGARVAVIGWDKEMDLLAIEKQGQGYANVRTLHAMGKANASQQKFLSLFTLRPTKNLLKR
ncbi:hypothetical protein GQ457_09G006450 [Hibiscus cannabinus]